MAFSKHFQSIFQTISLVARRLVVSAVLLGPAIPAYAGKFNPLLSPGDPSPSLGKLIGTDGKEHAWEEWKEAEVLVIAFTCSSCPTAVDYEDRMISLAKLLGEKKGALVAICSNDSSKAKEDDLEGMKARAAKKKFPFVYLRDPDQKMATAFGATVTPEFIVLNRERKVVYLGALDDSSDPLGVKVRYVEEAIAASLAGKTPAVAETPPRGCRVRVPRKRE